MIDITTLSWRRLGPARLLSPPSTTGSCAARRVAISKSAVWDRFEDPINVVIVDEFHHAAAPSYRRLLDRLEPDELLGLTATPERMDA